MTTIDTAALRALLAETNALSERAKVVGAGPRDYEVSMRLRRELLRALPALLDAAEERDALRAKDAAWKQLALRVDSMFSLIFHRAGIRWGGTGMVNEYEASRMVAALRAASERGDPEAALEVIPDA